MGVVLDLHCCAEHADQPVQRFALCRTHVRRGDDPQGTFRSRARSSSGSSSRSPYHFTNAQSRSTSSALSISARSSAPRLGSSLELVRSAASDSGVRGRDETETFPGPAGPSMLSSCRTGAAMASGGPASCVTSWLTVRSRSSGSRIARSLASSSSPTYLARTCGASASSTGPVLAVRSVSRSSSSPSLPLINDSYSPSRTRSSRLNAQSVTRTPGGAAFLVSVALSAMPRQSIVDDSHRAEGKETNYGG